MKTNFAIGCLVQWYEVAIIEEYIDSLYDALENYEGKVLVDFTIVLNQDLEKIVWDSDPSSRARGGLLYAIDMKIKKFIEQIEYGSQGQVHNTKIRSTNELTTIADYRRDFNKKYCDCADVLIWGESDSILPKQMFTVLDSLHNTSLQNNNPKYLAFFGTCKMWDDTWKQLEHPDFTDKPFIDGDEENWWSLRYDMTKDEMNAINDKTDELDVQIASPHKFNGCGLVISSEVIKAGVNIPKSVFFIHEDSAFMMMTNKILGNIPQYIIKNILLVHNRKHKNKRKHIKGEENVSKKDVGNARLSHDWYMIANKMCEQNYLNLFNPNYKSFTWKDVWKNLKK